MTWLLYLVIAVLVIAMIVLVVVIVRAGGFGRLRAVGVAREEAAEAARRPSEIAPPARLSTAIAIAARELRVLVAGGRGPVEVPWTLAVGAGGDALRALLPPPMEAQHEISWIDEQRLSNAGTVSFRTGGVVVGFTDGLVGVPRAERRLSGLLRAVEIVRPDRPIDSIAIVVPWRTLAAAGDDEVGREAIATLGRQLYQIVLTVQRRTGWRVPVHVLLSGCEEVAGFSAYATAALAHSDHPVIGWPAPKSLDSMFETSWLDEAFATLGETLAAQQLHLLMGVREPHAVEDILLLPGRLAAIKPAVATLLTQMLQSSAYHEGFMLRGVFLTGASEADAAAAAADMMAAAAAVAPATTPLAPLPVAVPGALPAAAPLVLASAPPPQRLAQALFLTKIFPESYLAQPAYGERTRRHRLIRRTQIALAATAAAAACLLGLVGYQSGQRMVPVQRLLQNIIDIQGDVRRERAALRDPATGHCLDDAAAPAERDRQTDGDFEEKRRLSIELLDLMSELDVNHVATILAPTSFLADTDDNVELAIKTSFHDVVFHSIAESMATPPGVRSLVGRNAAVPSTEDYWPTTMRNVVDYNTNYRILRSLERRSADDGALMSNFAALVRYSLGDDLPAGFTRNYRLYATGIAHYAVPCIASDEVRQTLRTEIAARYDRTIDAAYLHSPVSMVVQSMTQRFSGGAATAAYPSAGSGGTPGDPTDVSLKALIGDVDILAGQLAIPGRYAWIYAADPPLPAVQPLLGLDVVDAAFVRGLPGNSGGRVLAEASRLREAQLFGTLILSNGALAPLAPAFQPVPTAPAAAASTPATLGALAVGVAAAPPAAAAAPLAGPQPSQAMLDSRDFLRTLFAQSFMSDSAPAVFGYGAGGWDYARLRIAADALKEFDAFSGIPSGAMPGDLRALAIASARRHFVTRVNQIVDRATAGGGIGSDADATAFVQALPTLTGLRNALVEAGAGSAAASLDARVADRAGALLAASDRQLGGDNGPYAVDHAGLAAWRGNGSLAAAVFGMPTEEDLAGSLPARRGQIATIARGRATALVAYLRDPNTTPTAQGAARAARWQAILETLQSYDAGSPNNSLTRLERFMTTDIDRLQRDCARLRASRTGTADYFAAQQAAITRAIATRCGSVATAGARSQFDRLRDAFNANLAGRFPFGDARAPAADPGAVQRFFADFGDALQPLGAQIAAERPDADAAAVLRQLDAVRIALAPMLAGPGPLAYSVEVDFLTDPTLAQGQRQIVEARLGPSAANQARTPHGPASFTWANGQPLALALRWAVNAPSVPVEAVDPAAGRCLPPPGGGIATARTAGAWALLRLIAQHRPGPAEDAAPSPELGIPVAFDVPVCANLQRASGGDDTPGPARVFLRLHLAATVRTPDKPDRQEPVELPVFPRAIPPLP